MNYTQEQLEAAFQKVQNKEHWKNPIRSIIPVEDMPITDAAIRHFTATEPSFVFITDSLVQVRSIGYRCGPAGDH